MESVFSAVNGVFSFIGPLSDFLWDFPTNLAWYSAIPVLGNFSLAVILLVGSGIFFTCRLKFVQVRHFKSGVRLLLNRQKAKTGISPFAAFCLSSAMRVGPGNILGVTGAISVGGPGALVWMWISAFFGMATAYVESVLAQIFKEKKGDEYVGGLPFYGKRLLGDKQWIGAALSGLFILYALCCLPAQGFNAVDAIGRMAAIVTGTEIAKTSAFYYCTAAVMLGFTCVVTFGGIKKVTGLTDKVVPVMAAVYCAVVALLILLNLDKLPFFFGQIFGGMFSPNAFFGGVFGTVLAQGVKRGLMSNEAGQGTITMAAAAADASHPCEQGFVQSIGVFLDTIIICTMTGFVIVMPGIWQTGAGEAWMALDRLPKFLAAAAEMTPGLALNGAVTLLLTLCFGLFAYTTLIGMISFGEIAASRISRGKRFLASVRIVSLAIVGFGILCNLAGLELGNLWAFSDLGNILIVYANIPLLYLGMTYVFRATAHYDSGQRGFDSSAAGIDCPCWDERAKEQR